MKNINKNKKEQKFERREFLKKVASGAKLATVAVVSSEIIEYVPSLKSQRPDLLPGGEGDFEGV